jgi:integrase
MPIIRVEITDAYLRTLRPPERGHVEVWDTGPKELVTRLWHTGSYGEWAVRARTPAGKRIRTSLEGRWPSMSIKQARIKAKVVLGRIASGVDPVAERRAARQAEAAKRGAPTVARRLAEWREARASTWSERYATEVARLCAKIIEPKLGDQPLASTTRADWVGLIAAKRKSAPATSTWLYQLCSSFLNHAEAAGWIANPLLPRKGLGLIAPRAASRERILSDAELVAVWTASELLSPKTRAFIRVLILCALREMECADLAVGEVNLMAARITLSGSRTKNRQSHTVPLHPLLITELRAIWPDRRVGESYRIFGAVKGSGFRGFSGLKTRLANQLPNEMAPWRWHDLRRSARSTMARLGVPALHAECALNHVSGRSQLEKTYDRHDYLNETISALEVWQQHIAGLIAEREKVRTNRVHAA